ncbi:MAG: hypothetical protein JOZ17_09745 [Acetobacteraceae bacterium]|nr:hypothetical protein [Acetobacteraceae bacterium]
MWARALLFGALFLGSQNVQKARADESNDLREFRVGMKVEELPRAGYLDFSCAAAPSKKLTGWQDYRECPADSAGLREVSFRYDESANTLAKINDQYEGTRVGGHPVLVSLLIDDQGTVAGLKIVTDPKARLYMHKKAFLLGQQAKAHYGEDGWTCTEAQPSADEEPVGGVFIKEHCEKTTPTRRILVERDLFRHPGQELKDFVGDSKVTILLPSVRTH